MGIVLVAILTGCGTPGAPQPPSLHLPGRVEDLTARRSGNSVALHWTMPRKTTDHMLIKGSVPVVVCRGEGSIAKVDKTAAFGASASAAPEGCQAKGDEQAGLLSLAPGGEADFTDTLPVALSSGPPRQLAYFVELRSPKGRSAGPSDLATVVAGAAPGPMAGFSAEVRAEGVALRWAENQMASAEGEAVRLHRRLLTSQPKPKAGGGVMSAPAELELQDLLVEPSASHLNNGAVDQSARFGLSYEYTAQRVERVTVDGKTFELAGELSPPVRVEVVDNFPPAVPLGLAAVFVAGDDGMPNIDLNWQPDTEPDLAGYIVYRATPGGDWKRISPSAPLPTSAFRDSMVEPGKTYRYAVSAIDQTGHESKRSEEAEESAPNP